MIRINCSCGESLQTGDENAVQRIRCPKCLANLTAPERAEVGFVPAPPDQVRSGPVPLAPTAGDPNEHYERERPRRQNTPAEATSRKAVFSFVLGLLTFVVALVLGFVAPIWAAATSAVFGLSNIILASMAISEVNRSNGRLAGFVIHRSFSLRSHGPNVI